MSGGRLWAGAGIASLALHAGLGALVLSILPAPKKTAPEETTVTVERVALETPRAVAVPATAPEPVSAADASLQPAEAEIVKPAAATPEALAAAEPAETVAGGVTPADAVAASQVAALEAVSPVIATHQDAAQPPAKPDPPPPAAVQPVQARREQPDLPQRPAERLAAIVEAAVPARPEAKRATAVRPEVAVAEPATDRKAPTAAPARLAAPSPGAFPAASTTPAMALAAASPSPIVAAELTATIARPAESPQSVLSQTERDRVHPAPRVRPDAGRAAKTASVQTGSQTLAPLSLNKPEPAPVAGSPALRQPISDTAQADRIAAVTARPIDAAVVERSAIEAAAVARHPVDGAAGSDRSEFLSTAVRNEGGPTQGAAAVAPQAGRRPQAAIAAVETAERPEIPAAAAPARAALRVVPEKPAALAPVSANVAPAGRGDAAPQSSQDIAIAAVAPRRAEALVGTETDRGSAAGAAPGGRRQTLAEIVADYPGGECFAALTARSDAPGIVRVTALSDRPDELDDFAEALSLQTPQPSYRRIEIDGGRVGRAQCRALAFLKDLPGYPDFSLRLSLDRRRVASGETLSGSIEGLAPDETLDLLLVDDEGLVQSLSGFLKRDGAGARFAVPVSPSGSAVETAQLVVALSLPKALIHAEDAEGEPAGAFFEALASALSKNGLSGEFAVDHFVIRERR